MIEFFGNKTLTLPGGINLFFVQIPGGHLRLGQENMLMPVDSYFIAVYPITVEQYHCFIESNGYSNESYWSPAGWRWRETDKIEFPGDRNLPEPFQQPDHPQVSVSWYEVNAYCTWLSEYSGCAITLPNEFEWEKAARGKDSRKYPWGETPPTDIHCNFDNGKGYTTQVGIYPAGKSPFGCYDMAGNVWEWCRNTDGTLPYKNIQEREDQNTRSAVAMRGGGWASSRQDLLTWQRGFNFPIVRLSMLGFRVVLKI